jgi:hypothetical protein
MYAFALGAVHGAAPWGGWAAAVVIGAAGIRATFSLAGHVEGMDVGEVLHGTVAVALVVVALLTVLDRRARAYFGSPRVSLPPP